jgi:phage baseplate assembly protein W
MKNRTKSFLGTGWSFPPTFESTQGSVEMTSDEIDIQKSLQILLTTRLGERVMRPDFGCNLNDMVFEAMNLNTKTYIYELIKSAILYFEPRIELEAVEVVPQLDNEGIFMIEIQYTVRATNSRQNFVFPFYKEEGTDLNNG